MGVRVAARLSAAAPDVADRCALNTSFTGRLLAAVVAVIVTVRRVTVEVLLLLLVVNSVNLTIMLDITVRAVG